MRDRRSGVTARPASRGTHTRCCVCSSWDLDKAVGYEGFRRVSSDCRPWLKGGRLFVCRRCGCVQKAADRSWWEETRRIYEGYRIYHQSNGLEQSVFAEGSAPVARSASGVSRPVGAVRPLS